MMEKKVSIIVPVYNYEEYVERCVLSLLNQSYRNIEVLLVDDGSTDMSGVICDQLAEKDNRIKVKHQANGGIGKACETALSMLTGDYVAFVDSDDYMSLDAYEYLVSLAEETKADIIEFGTNTYNTEGTVLSSIVLNEGEIIGNERIIETYFFEEKLPHLSSKFIRAELFENFHFFEYSVAIDELTTMQLLLRSEKIVKTNRCFYNAVRYKESVSKGAIEGRRVKEIFLSNDEMLRYLHNCNSSYLSYYAMDVLKKHSVMYYRVEKEGFAANSDVSDVKTILKKYYKKAYKYINWKTVYKKYSWSDIFGVKVFRYFPTLFCILYRTKRKG